MRFGNSISIDHSALLTPSSRIPDNVAFTSHTANGEFGSLISKNWLLPGIAITSIRGVLRKDLHVRHYDERESSAVNCLYVMEGTVSSSFAGLGKELTLTKGCQNFIYKPEVMDDHFLSAEGDQLSLLHVAVNRSRFVEILCSDEKWCDELKAKISSKQPVSGGDCPLTISSAMYRTLDDIMNCPITGSLGTIYLEAKVLELTVYQLHQYHSFNVKFEKPISRSDREIFFEIKTYLRSSYEKDHSLRSLSRQFGINEFKLKKGFKELFGTTVFGYIHTLKMQHARTMMEESGSTVSQAASRIGYKNPNHFSVAFKKQFGLSPSSLRRLPVLI